MTDDSETAASPDETSPSDGGTGPADGETDTRDSSANTHLTTDSDSEFDSDTDSDSDSGVKDGSERTHDADINESNAENREPSAEENTRPTTGADPSRTDSETVPTDVQRYERFSKMDGAQYDRVNEFLRDRTYVTAREWAIARLCADFRTETGVEMTKIGENLPQLIPFMTDTYSPQAVNQARASFEQKVTKAGATFLYGAMSGFFTAGDLDEVMYEVTEVAKFLLEVEGVDLDVEDELEAEDRISSVMRDVRESSQRLRNEQVQCPECGHVHEPHE
jgi:hypothetical protein